MTSPVKNCGATFEIRRHINQVSHDLNAKDPIGKITVIKCESEIGIGRGCTTRVIGGGGLHRGSWVK